MSTLGQLFGGCASNNVSKADALADAIYEEAINDAIRVVEIHLSQPAQRQDLVRRLRNLKR